MKPSLLIEPMANGWIVRPIATRMEYGMGMVEPSVFNKIEDLQAALPGLLTPKETKWVSGCCEEKVKA